MLCSKPGLYSYRFGQNSAGPPLGKNVDLRIKGESVDRLIFISEWVKQALQEIPGVTDIQDSFARGKKEVKILPRHDVLAMCNLSVAQIASTIRMASVGTYKQSIYLVLFHSTTPATASGSYSGL